MYWRILIIPIEMVNINFGMLATADNKAIELTPISAAAHSQR